MGMREVSQQELFGLVCEAFGILPEDDYNFLMITTVRLFTHYIANEKLRLHHGISNKPEQPNLDSGTQVVPQLSPPITEELTVDIHKPVTTIFQYEDKDKIVSLTAPAVSQYLTAGLPLHCEEEFKLDLTLGERYLFPQPIETPDKADQPHYPVGTVFRCKPRSFITDLQVDKIVWDDRPILDKMGKEVGRLQRHVYHCHLTRNAHKQMMTEADLLRYMYCWYVPKTAQDIHHAVSQVEFKDVKINHDLPDDLIVRIGTEYFLESKILPDIADRYNLSVSTAREALDKFKEKMAIQFKR